MVGLGLRMCLKMQVDNCFVGVVIGGFASEPERN